MLSQWYEIWAYDRSGNSKILGEYPTFKQAVYEAQQVNDVSEFNRPVNIDIELCKNTDSGVSRSKTLYQGHLE